MKMNQIDKSLRHFLSSFQQHVAVGRILIFPEISLYSNHLVKL